MAMAMSTFQKVTLATCLVLCVALLLPKMLLSRGRKDAAERPEGSGRFPPMMHRQAPTEGRGQRPAGGSGFSRAHNSEAVARGKGAGTGAGTGGKSNLAGQIIPVYGFGILLYILYILFKITSKGNSKPSEGRFPAARSENLKRKITDYELSQLQDKLRETEMMMENIVSNAHHSPDRMNGVTADQQESLLQQLTVITQVMQEGQLVEGMTPEREARDHWEDYPEEPHQYWEHSRCSCQHSQQHDGPQSETEAERTEADGAVTAGDTIIGGEDVSTDAVRAVGEEDAQPDCDSSPNNMEDLHELTERRGQSHEDKAGVAKELGLTLEQENNQDPNPLVETQTSVSHVRRRNKRRRAKKASH